MSEPAGAVSVSRTEKITHQKEKEYLLAISSGANLNFDRFKTILLKGTELGEDKEKILSIQIPEKDWEFFKTYQRYFLILRLQSLITGFLTQMMLMYWLE